MNGSGRFLAASDAGLIAHTMSTAGVTEPRGASIIQIIRDRTDLVAASTAARADQSAAAGDMAAAREALSFDPTNPARLAAFRRSRDRHAAATDARRSAASALREACLASAPQTIRDTLPRAAADIPAGIPLPLSVVDRPPAELRALGLGLLLQDGRRQRRSPGHDPRSAGALAVVGVLVLGYIRP